MEEGRAREGRGGCRDAYPVLSLREECRRREIDVWGESSSGHVDGEAISAVERLKWARGWVEDEARQVWVEGIDTRRSEMAGAAATAAQLARAREEREKEEGKGTRRQEGISEAGIRWRGASSAQLADGDAWHAEMRALPLTRGKTDGTGFQNRWHRFWSSQTEKFLANGFGRVSLTNVRD